jgi:hypothetical protein
MARLKERGKIAIGVKLDIPRFGVLKPRHEPLSLPHEQLLLSHEVDLISLLTHDPHNFKIVGKPFTVEPYGMDGYQKGTP